MNQHLLLLLFLGFFSPVWSQPNKLFVKKGIHKKKVFSEGDRIYVLLDNAQEHKGIITNLQDSIVYINGREVSINRIRAVYIEGIRKNQLPDAKTLLLIGAGVGLTTLGLSLNDANDPQTALIAGATIGYGPLVAKFLFGRLFYALKRKKFKIGRKYQLQVFDIRPARKQAF